MANPLLNTPLVQSVGWALIHFVWQGTAIGIATAIALRVLAGSRPTVRYGVACFSLALMLTVPVAAVFSDRASGPITVSAPHVASVVMPPVPLDRVLPSAVFVWLAGVSLLSLRLIAACAGVERLKRATRAVDATVAERVQSLAQRFGIDRHVRVFESTLVRVPTVVGYLRPVILLPASVITGLAPAYLDAVIAHELAHVRRHDYLVNVLQSLVETLLFYHPAVWWCSRQIRIEREHCCDDMVVEAGGNRVAYAAALAQLEELRGLQPMLSLNASGGRLIDRIRRLLGGSPMKERRSTTWTIAAALAVVTAIVVTPGRSVADASELVTSPQSESPQSNPTQVPAPQQTPQRQPQPGSQPTPQPAPQARPQPPLPPVPPVPTAAPVAPAPGSVPAVPAPPVPPNMQRPLLAPAVPAPPIPPIEPLGLDPDSINELVNSARLQIAESLEQLREATKELSLKQEAIRQAQAELAKMRIESLASKAQVETMQKALSDFSAKSAAQQFDRQQMQKLIDELNAELAKMRVR